MNARLLACSIACAAPLALAGATSATNTPTQVHAARGLIREIATDRTSAVIRHEAIPGYMPPMTMKLNVRDTNELSGIAQGDTVTFRLLANDDTHWIDRVKKVVGATNATPAAAPASIPGLKELAPGDPMPDAQFLDEQGRTIRIADFRGRALAFTFFFTRCPLPDYCPLMNKNFSAARRQLLADTNAPANWNLLCISFDSEFDKPAVLAAYARTYRGDDTNHWVFASASPATLKTLAPQLDLVVQADGPGFSHNLRTVVLDTQGRIHKQFDGNRWTPDQLATALREAGLVPVKGGGTEPE